MSRLPLNIKNVHDYLHVRIFSLEEIAQLRFNHLSKGSMILEMSGNTE